MVVIVFVVTFGGGVALGEEAGEEALDEFEVFARSTPGALVFVMMVVMVVVVIGSDPDRADAKPTPLTVTRVPPAGVPMEGSKPKYATAGHAIRTVPPPVTALSDWLWVKSLPLTDTSSSRVGDSTRPLDVACVPSLWRITVGNVHTISVARCSGVGGSNEKTALLSCGLMMVALKTLREPSRQRGWGRACVSRSLLNMIGLFYRALCVCIPDARLAQPALPHRA